MEEPKRVERMARISRHQAAEIAQPSAKPLPLPASARTAKWTTILRLGADASTAVWRDHLDSQPLQCSIKRISVVSDCQWCGGRPLEGDRCAPGVAAAVG